VCLGIGGDEVKFDAKGDGLGKYDIFQYQNVQDNRYNYVRVGEWVDRWVDRHCFFSDVEGRYKNSFWQCY